MKAKMWTALLLVAATGCSQNYSDKSPGEAVEAQGMQMAGGAPESAQSAPAAKPAATATGRKSLGGINVAVPAGWRDVAPSSSMRVAEYHMSGARPQDQDATLAVFAGKMGTVEANVSRWIGQFKPTDGQPRRWTQQVDGMAVTLVDVSGTFAPGAMGRPQAAEPQAGHRMMGAIVDYGPKFFYFKLTGPKDTVGLWAPIFEEFIGGIEKD